MIDSNDRERIEEARAELARIIQDREMKDALLLVFANKQDVAGGMSYLPHLLISLLNNFSNEASRDQGSATA